jgi:hypothetical protein
MADPASHDDRTARLKTQDDGHRKTLKPQQEAPQGGWKRPARRWHWYAAYSAFLSFALGELVMIHRPRSGHLPSLPCSLLEP